MQHVDAVAVTSFYRKENPLSLQPGQTREVTYLLQNMVGDEDFTLQAELEQPNPYVTFKDKVPVYKVPAKTKDIPVTIIIAVPSDAKIGTVMPVTVAFKTLKKEGEQQVALGVGITKTFDLIISTESSQEHKETIAPTIATPQKSPVELLKKPATPALIVLIIVVIVWLLLRRSRKGRKANVDGQNARW